MKYSRTVTYLLPSPYQTNCFDYTKIRCKSRSNCIDKCNIEWALKNCNSLPLSTNVDIHNNKYKFSSNECIVPQHCKQKNNLLDCINEYYEIKPILMSGFKERFGKKFVKTILPKLNGSTFKLNKDDINLITSIQIIYGDEHDTIYTHSPQQKLVEIISFVGGIISLWTGFSVLSIYAYGRRIFIRNQIKEQSKKSIQVLISNINKFFINKTNGKMPIVNKIWKFIKKKDSKINVIDVIPCEKASINI